MQTQIQKFPLNYIEGESTYYTDDPGHFAETTIKVPAKSKLISCIVQINVEQYGYNPRIVVYFEVPIGMHNNPEVQWIQPRYEEYLFKVFGTGEKFEKTELDTFYKTINYDKGSKIWHVYCQYLGYTND